MVSDDELMVASERSGLIRSIMGHPSGLDLPISESGLVSPVASGNS